VQIGSHWNESLMQGSLMTAVIPQVSIICMHMCGVLASCVKNLAMTARKARNMFLIIILYSGSSGSTGQNYIGRV